MRRNVVTDGVESLSSTVVETLADHEGVDPVALDPPIYEAIDPDALNKLFPPHTNRRRHPTGRLTFSYKDYHVQVTSDGDVHILDPDAE